MGCAAVSVPRSCAASDRTGVLLVRGWEIAAGVCGGVDWEAEGGQGVSSSGAHDTVTGPLCRRGRRLGGTMVQSSRGRRHGAGGVNYTNKGFSETYISISVCSRQIFAVNFYGESHPVSPRHYLTLLTSLPHYHRTSSNIASPRACFPPYGYERVATCPPRTCTPRSRNRHPRRPHAGLRGRGGGAPARTRRCADRSCGQ